MMPSLIFYDVSPVFQKLVLATSRFVFFPLWLYNRCPIRYTNIEGLLIAHYIVIVLFSVGYCFVQRLWPIYSLMARSYLLHLCAPMSASGLGRVQDHVRNLRRSLAIDHKSLSLLLHNKHNSDCFYLNIFPSFCTKSCTLLFAYCDEQIHHVWSSTVHRLFRLFHLSFSYFNFLAELKYEKPVDFNRVERAFLNPCTL